MKQDAIIIGAGPAGMASALFLHQKGIRAGIIEKRADISQHSKALGANPRSLELLEQIRLTEKFLSRGRKMHRLNIWQGHRKIFVNQLSHVRHKYPFMLILPQRASEEILQQALIARNIHIERGVELAAFQPAEGNMALTLSKDGEEEKRNYPLVIGADGAHSQVRKSLNIHFEGFRYEEVWEIYDVALDTPLAQDDGHVMLLEDGGMIMIRLSDNIWRVASNMKNTLNYLPAGTVAGQIVWQSGFHISHRIAQSLGNDKVVLIGDAAHLHSPVGARGMNLGIEDAYLSAALISQGRLGEYQALRWKYLKNTVARINAMTQVVTGQNTTAKMIRKNMHMLSVFFPLVMPFARKFVMGLNK